MLEAFVDCIARFSDINYSFADGYGVSFRHLAPEDWELDFLGTPFGTVFFK